MLVSKPPAAEVAAELTAYAASLGTPVAARRCSAPGQPDLTAAAEAVLRAASAATCPSLAGARRGRAPATGGALRGLFVGGTLCDEAMLIASARSADRSNIPLGRWALGATGADGTRGRLRRRRATRRAARTR